MCYLLVTGTFSCVLKVSDRFSEYKENPENTGFSGGREAHAPPALSCGAGVPVPGVSAL